MRLLVVEDYEPIRDAVVRALQEESYAVDSCREGQKAVEMAIEHDYDVVLLDINLPRKDGLSVLREMREANLKSHVLLITGRSAPTDRIEGLDLGADDYVVKPFDIDELLARVRALIRRSYQRPEPVIAIGHVEINTTQRSVHVEGQSVILTAREYALLEFLAFRRDQIVSRTDIWEHVYEDDAASGSNVVDVYVGYLRKKLERKDLPRILHTRRGQGYLLSSSASA